MSHKSINKRGLKASLEMFRTSGIHCLSLLLATAAFSFLPVTDGFMDHAVFSASVIAQEDEEGRRPPPPTRSSQTLSRRVYQRIEDVMELQTAENYTGALVILDEIKEMYDEGRLNDREQFVMWQFYAVLRQSLEDYGGALDAYNEILNIDPERVTQDQVESTLWAIGALQFFLEEYQNAIDTYNQYLEVALEPNEEVYLRMGTAYYQLENYLAGIPMVTRYMEVLRNMGEEIPQNAYSLLRAMYITVEDYPNARQTLREMIVLYGESDDWIYLSGVLGQMEEFQQQALVYWVSDVAGYLDSESELINLAAQMFNNENPYGCSKVVRRGLEQGIIEENLDNLSFLAQCYQVAREDALAAESLEKAAVLADDGELYSRLGTVYQTMGEFEKSVEAFESAFEKGDLNRPDQVYLRLARSYLELNRHDEGIEAAREASTDERSRDTAEQWMTHIANEKRRYETLQENRRRYEGFFL